MRERRTERRRFERKDTLNYWIASILYSEYGVRSMGTLLYYLHMYEVIPPINIPLFQVKLAGESSVSLTTTSSESPSVPQSVTPSSSSSSLPGVQPLNMPPVQVK